MSIRSQSYTVRELRSDRALSNSKVVPRPNAKQTNPDHAGSVQQPQWKGEMAKQYPFKLDPFQSTSVACLVSMQSTMVTSFSVLAFYSA